MDVVIFEPDALIGTDLRDGVRELGARSRWVRDVAAAQTALAKAGHRTVLMVASKVFVVHRAALAPDIGALAARVVLMASDGIPPSGLDPAAILPSPFTQDDIIRVVGGLLGVEP